MPNTSTHTCFLSRKHSKLEPATLRFVPENDLSDSLFIKIVAASNFLLIENQLFIVQANKKYSTCSRGSWQVNLSMNVNAFFTILKMNKRVKCDRILYSSAFNFNVIHAVYLKKKRITCVREEDVFTPLPFRHEFRLNWLLIKKLHAVRGAYPWLCLCSERS